MYSFELSLSICVFKQYAFNLATRKRLSSVSREMVRFHENYIVMHKLLSEHHDVMYKTLSRRVASTARIETYKAGD